MGTDRGVKLYDRNFTEDDLEDLQRGDVIVYDVPGESMTNYLVVKDIDMEEGVVHGQIACTIGVNSVPLERLVNSKE